MKHCANDNSNTNIREDKVLNRLSDLLITFFIAVKSVGSLKFK